MATDMEKWAREEDEAWASRDVEKILSFYADDILYEDLALGMANHGKAKVRAFLTDIFQTMPDFTITNQTITASAERVALECVMTGTNTGNAPGFPPATGKPISIRCVHFCEVKDGKAYRITDYYNQMTLLQQLGLAPEMPHP